MDFKEIKLNDSQFDFLERSIKMWKSEKNYKLRNNLSFGIISELDYILFGGSNNGKD